MSFGRGTRSFASATRTGGFARCAETTRGPAERRAARDEAVATRCTFARAPFAATRTVRGRDRTAAGAASALSFATATLTGTASESAGAGPTATFVAGV